VTPSDLPDEDPFDIEVERGPLMRTTADPHLPAPPGEEAMADEPGPDARLAKDSNDIAYIEEMQRQRNIAHKATGQCHGDIGVYTNSSRLLVDVAVGDATAPSFLTPPAPAR
jgi:hypothetical protein